MHRKSKNVNTGIPFFRISLIFQIFTYTNDMIRKELVLCVCLVALLVLGVSIYVLAVVRFHWSLVTYAVLETIGCGALVIRELNDSNEMLQITYLTTSVLGLAFGLIWVHFNVFDTQITPCERAIVYLFICLQFIKGVLVEVALKHKVQDKERIVTPSSYNTIQVHKIINNKDSLQTLVPFSSRQSLFQLRQDSFSLPHSQNSSTDKISKPYYNAYLNDTEVILNEKNMIAHINNSLLPPLLQKGENNIHRNQEQLWDLENIPQIPKLLEWSKFEVDSGKKFISLQDWEENKQDWLKDNNLKGNSMLSESEDNAPSLHSFRDGFKTPQKELSPNIEGDENEDDVDSIFDTLSKYPPQESLNNETFDVHQYHRKSRRNSISPSRTKSKSTSPIKKIFNSQQHKHSQSLYSIDQRHPRKKSSFLNLQMSSTTPRRTKSLSPQKKQIDLNHTPESLQSNNSPCPSIVMGEYDREKWRRIKLKLDKETI